MTAITEKQEALIRRLLRERIDEHGDTGARLKERPSRREATAIIERLLKAPLAAADRGDTLSDLHR